MTRHTRRSARSSLVEREGQWPGASAVTSVELFFDLVFVFAVTQLTAAVGRDPTWHGVGRVVLLLSLMWWMYGGYAWLTNAAPPVTTARRLFLLAARRRPTLHDVIRPGRPSGHDV